MNASGLVQSEGNKVNSFTELTCLIVAGGCAFGKMVTWSIRFLQ